MHMSAFSSLLGILTAASAVYCLLCLVAAHRFMKGTGASPKLLSPPPVSILIPLCGVDFEALANYRTFCSQDYPRYQIVFGVQDPEDTSIPVVEELMTLFPQRDIDLVICSTALGQNPKVSNLHNMLAKAKHEYVVIADSDVRVGPDYLQTIMGELLEGGVGLVTCPYRAAEASGLPSRLEALGISSEFIPGVLVAHLLEGITFALGATMATNKETIEVIGGLPSVADHLADDYRLGNLIAQAGLEVRLSRYVVETMPAHTSFSGFLRHQLRWARGTRMCRPMSYIGYVVAHGIPLGLLWVLCAKASLLSVTALCCVAFARFAVAWNIGVRLLRDRTLLKFLWLLPLRDLLGFGVWCASFLGNRVEWRGKKYTVAGDGKLHPVP